MTTLTTTTISRMRYDFAGRILDELEQTAYSPDYDVKERLFDFIASKMGNDKETLHLLSALFVNEGYRDMEDCDPDDCPYDDDDELEAAQERRADTIRKMISEKV